MEIRWKIWYDRDKIINKVLTYKFKNGKVFLGGGNMNEGLELIIKKFKRTLEKYSTCDECDIRHTCAKIGNKSGLYICEMLKEIEKELNIN